MNVWLLFTFDSKCKGLVARSHTEPELEMWKDVVVAYFKVIFHNFPEEAEENRENFVRISGLRAGKGTNKLERSYLHRKFRWKDQMWWGPAVWCDTPSAAVIEAMARQAASGQTMLEEQTGRHCIQWHLFYQRSLQEAQRVKTIGKSVGDLELYQNIYIHIIKRNRFQNGFWACVHNDSEILLMEICQSDSKRKRNKWIQMYCAFNWM